jgi:hypothetical protein
MGVVLIGTLAVAEVELDALIVGALGADAVPLAHRLAGAATRGAHPLDRGLDLVETEHRDHRRTLCTDAETGHRGDT